LLSRGLGLYDPLGMLRATLAWMVLSLFAAGAHAGGTLTGKLELPTPPERPAPEVKGFLDRVENPLAPVKPVAPTNKMFIVLLGDEKPMSPPQTIVELLGESFAHRVVAAPDGSEVVIKNLSKTARSLVAAEQKDLVPQGPLNPTGSKSFRVTGVDKVFNLGDKDAPHLKLTIVAINTLYYAYPDETGKFEISGVPAGSYKVKIWYDNGWLDRPDDSVEVKDKGKTEFNPKVTALGAPAGKK
jgi:hypothetical protein